MIQFFLQNAKLGKMCNPGIFFDLPIFTAFFQGDYMVKLLFYQNPKVPNTTFWGKFRFFSCCTMKLSVCNWEKRLCHLVCRFPHVFLPSLQIFFVKELFKTRQTCSC
eukprot:EG_transcript_53559